MIKLFGGKLLREKVVLGKVQGFAEIVSQG